MVHEHEDSQLGPPVPPNTISAVLLSRGDGTFHWALALAIDNAPYSFRKLHATQLKGPGWEYEDIVHDITALQQRKPVCVIVQIGHISPKNSSESIACILSSTPLGIVTERETKETTFNCRVWVREALRVLYDESIISCSDVESLEQEFFSLAHDNDTKTVVGGPYKVHVSKFCVI